MLLRKATFFHETFIHFCYVSPTIHTTIRTQLILLSRHSFCAATYFLGQLVYFIECFFNMLFNLAKIFIKCFFHSILMQYFRLIRGIHISTQNLVFLYQGVVKSSPIAQNYVFRTPPLTILFFRRIRPRHSLDSASILLSAGLYCHNLLTSQPFPVGFLIPFPGAYLYAGSIYHRT